MKKYFGLFLFSFSLILCLTVAEIVLRNCGYVPGFVPIYSNEGLRPGVKLKVSNQFQADAEGVFKANPAANWKPPISIKPYSLKINMNGIVTPANVNPPNVDKK